MRLAARRAFIDDVIMKLPDQYETEVGERGISLSVGERQRIAMARAFLKDAPILLMDEPTSALDLESERWVIEGIRNLAKHRTTVIVSHHPVLFGLANRVIRLENGTLSALHDQTQTV